MEIFPENSDSITVQDLLNDTGSNAISVSFDDIRNLNVVLNNNDCGDVFFQRVCDVLSQDGFPFRVVQGKLKEGIQDSTIITLDMQYSAGSNTMIFAPIDNARVGYSDSLALSIQAGFQEKGMNHQKIVCGQVGFKKEEDGSVLHTVPTPTEEAIGNDFSCNFVTISFGTEKVDPVTVARGIESGLLRQKYYLDHYDTGSDLIYKSRTGEEIGVVADYFGSSVRDLCMMNGLKTMDALEERAILNPDIRHMQVFDPHASFQIVRDYSKVY